MNDDGPFVGGCRNYSRRKDLRSMKLFNLLTLLSFEMPLSSFSQPYLKPGEGPIVLVLAPTRELAVQIKEECDKFGASSEIKNT